VFTSKTQASAVVPSIVPPDPLNRNRRVPVEVERHGVVVGARTVRVTDLQPALFTLAGNGSGTAVALHVNGSVNSADSPAVAGSIVVLYATGFGSTDPPSFDGVVASAPFPRPKSPVSVVIAGRPAEVLYVGSAPGLVAGLIQLNVRIPVETEANPITPIVVNVGSATSPPDVTLAVRAAIPQ